MRTLKYILLMSLLCLFVPICSAPKLKVTTFDVDQVSCLASAIYYEAGNQRLEGQQAVAFVVLNRSQKYNMNVCQVIKQTIHGKKQFRWRETKILYKEQYIKAYQLALSMYLNPSYYKDNTHGSLFFHAFYVHPNWKYKRMVRIQDHIFYALE